MSGLTANAATAGSAAAAAAGATITELAQQHGVSRDSLVEYVQRKIQRTREANGQSPLDQSTLDQLVDHALDHDHGAGSVTPATEEPASAGYNATAQRTADRPRATGSISIFA
ncbi:MAG TPA: hypothetical protein VMJ65_16670 [Solirubrobacteraceae bacterium]|nr:hypothetical protein [Solirubrobacteraceae bacterium]